MTQMILNPSLGYPQEYKEFVAALAKPMGSHKNDLMHMAVGICGEAGELADAIKKHWVYGRELDSTNVIEELGDLLFYIQGMANFMGVDIEVIRQFNVNKLAKRYPTGYTDAAAIARADKIEDTSEVETVTEARFKILVIAENAPIPYGSVVSECTFNPTTNRYEGIHASHAGSYEVAINAEDCKVI